MAWRPAETIWYRCGHFLCTIFTRILFRPRISGRKNIPKSGAVIIAPTHRSMLDIPTFGCTTWRPVRFMVKKALFSNAFIKWYFETNGSFSVDKDGGDPAAVRKAVSILKSGDALVVFPEGKRNRQEGVGEIATGVGFLAVKGNCPIVPIGISGVDHAVKFKFGIPRFSKASIAVGEPITSHIDRTEKTSEVVNELIPVLKEEMQSLYEKSIQQMKS